MKAMRTLNYTVAYVFTYFSWSYFFSAGYLACNQLYTRYFHMRKQHEALAI